MKKLKVCSLFSGIGGFETGVFHALGKKNIDIVFSSEIDPYASKGYEIIYGDKPNGDIREVHEKDIPDHDLLVAGFPCQAFSAAGRRLGFEDTRGTLFFEIARIAKEKQPKIMLLENVKGLLSHDGGKTFETIISTLGDIGYIVDFTILNSKYFGVPQNRERIYIVAKRKWELEEWKLEGINKTVARTKKVLLEKGIVNTFNFDFPKEEKVQKSLKDILETEVEEIYYLDKEKEEKILSKISDKKQKEVIRIEDKRGGNSIHSWDLELKGPVDKEVKMMLNKMILERRKGEKDGNPISPEKVGATKEIFDSLVDKGYLKKVTEDTYDFQFGNLSFDVSKIMSNECISPTITCTDAERYGVIVEEEIGLSFLTGVTEKPNWLENGKELSRNYKQGSRIYDSEGVASTLSAQGVGGLGGYSGLYLVPEWRIRKLTPLECLRLQGFPDEYYKLLKENGISNSRIYKMAGNAVTTNVISEVVLKLKKHLIE